MDTNKMRDPVREQFEAWFRKEYQLEAGDQINFANGEVRMMLKGWIASREAMVVELPKFEDYPDSMERDMRESLRVVIEALGLKVAP